MDGARPGFLEVRAAAVLREPPHPDLPEIAHETDEAPRRLRSCPRAICALPSRYANGRSTVAITVPGRAPLPPDGTCRRGRPLGGHRGPAGPDPRARGVGGRDPGRLPWFASCSPAAMPVPATNYTDDPMGSSAVYKERRRCPNRSPRPVPPSSSTWTEPSSTACTSTCSPGERRLRRWGSNWPSGGSTGG